MSEDATSNLPWSEQFRITAKRWVDAHAAATLLEDTKSAFLSSRIQDLLREEPGIAVNRAETTVKASDYWQEWVKAMVEARKKADLLKVQLEYIRMRHTEEQSHNANRRAEMRL